MVSLGNVPFFLGLRWAEISHTWVSSFLIDTKWEVTIGYMVDKLFFKSFKPLSDPSNFIKIFVSICLVLFPSGPAGSFGLGRSWGGIYISFLNLPICPISTSLIFPTLYLSPCSNFGSHLAVGSLDENSLYDFRNIVLHFLIIQCLKLGILRALPTSYSKNIY